ncbi:MAG: hypothetical protein OEU55_16140, partial [Desulfobacterales bacterium]|nr:hypothetical protein [Desulfobacterales bacterium]
MTLIIHFLAQIIDNGFETVCFGLLDKITLRAVSYLFKSNFIRGRSKDMRNQFCNPFVHAFLGMSILFTMTACREEPPP